MLDLNLPIQIIAVLIAAISFLVILEGYGALALLVVHKLAGKTRDAAEFGVEINLVVRLFVGGLIYTLTLFFIGSLGLLTRDLVLIVSFIIPLGLFLLGRRWKSLQSLDWKKVYLENRWVFLGCLVFLLVTFILWFRPITNFDGVWYHISISKLFLQTNSIADQGFLSTYSLQPSLNYFWNLFPLSLPISTGVASIVINSTHTFMAVLSSFFAARLGSKVWKWNSLEQFLAPILILGTYETLRNLGVGGNDLLGLAYGLIAAVFCFYCLGKTSISWKHFVYGVFLLVGLASIKIFFTFFAAVLLGYLVFGAWEKLPSPRGSRRKLLIIFSILVLMFVVTYLPWIVRSYLATGRLLDPIGEPVLTARTYQYVASNPVDHWTKSIVERVYTSAWPFLTFVYSPLVLLGLLSISSKDLRKGLSNLWLVAVVSFSLTFTATIALGWRYYLPIATLFVFLGTAALFKFSREAGLNIYSKLLILFCIIAFLLLSVGRVIYSDSDSHGLPNIVRDIYISNFKGTEEYLSKKLVSGTYDYVQEFSPPGLNSYEKVFIGNGPGLQLHNLAYVKNPIVENHTYQKQFENLNSVEDFKQFLMEKEIRYIITRKQTVADVCKELKLPVPESCNTPNNFRQVFKDDKWNVTWYQLVR